MGLASHVDFDDHPVGVRGQKVKRAGKPTQKRSPTHTPTKNKKKTRKKKNVAKRFAS